MERHVGHTLHSLHDWYRRLFEELGWMLLAKYHRYDPKIDAYLFGIDQLMMVISEKVGDTQSLDKVNDLHVMAANLVILQTHARRLLVSTSKRSSR